ncbi:MAG: 30S ribosomal protein S24e [Candidatus Jordarchaeum sp.]|uniref:30S ribosomal protein S24e n=1 Tax=Candidatus Jordarchaeum sp. TaxID=2823881 RepID=UPI004049D276
MEVSIISRKENPLLEREELIFLINHESQGTPSREEIRNKLAAILDVDTDKLFIKKIESEYGSTRSKGVARIYKSKERALLVEPHHIVKRNIGETVEGGKKPKEKKQAKPAKIKKIK